jgi:hypothetical protein
MGRAKDDRKEMRAAAYAKLIEATKPLASAGLPLLAERLRSWPYRLISRPTTNLQRTYQLSGWQDKCL